jgi:hypothetical protein
MELKWDDFNIVNIGVIPVSSHLCVCDKLNGTKLNYSVKVFIVIVHTTKLISTTLHRVFATGGKRAPASI